MKIEPASTVGRIVHFVNDVAAGEVPWILPAIITRVHGDGSVNLQVFLDIANGSKLYTVVRHDTDGDEPHTWHWPPRV